MAAADVLIKLSNVTLGYGRHPAVHHVEGSFLKGSMTAVVGPNGSGKSTLLLGLGGQLQPFQGHIEWNCSRRDIAYLPQQADIDRRFPITVFELLSLGLWHKTGFWRAINKKWQQQAEEALAAVGLTGFEKRPIRTLSGGQMQRLLFARVLLQDSAVVLLDEPFTAIDSKTTADLLHIVHHWHQQQKTIIAVLHDLEMVQQHFPQTLLMARQAVAWGNSQAVLSETNLQKSRHMAEAWAEHPHACTNIHAA
ncbi:MAG: metal ABC transporter ATP-binding protein [Alphaproteobacteria bacterium]